MSSGRRTVNGAPACVRLFDYASSQAEGVFVSANLAGSRPATTASMQVRNCLIQTLKFTGVTNGPDKIRTCDLVLIRDAL